MTEAALLEFVQIIRALSAGLLNTLLITLTSMAIGLAGGAALALAHQVVSGRPRVLLRCGVYTVQSVPALVLIFMAMFGLPEIGVRLPSFITVVACLGLIAAVRIGEVLRASLDSIDRVQREAGLTLGLSPRQVFWFVLMPQMWRISIPGLINEFTSVLKNSPFAYVAGVPEIMKEVNAITAVTSRGMPVYIAAVILFLALYLGCTTLFHALYRRFKIPGFDEA